MFWFIVPINVYCPANPHQAKVWTIDCDDMQEAFRHFVREAWNTTMLEDIGVWYNGKLAGLVRFDGENPVCHAFVKSVEV